MYRKIKKFQITAWLTLFAFLVTNTGWSSPPSSALPSGIFSSAIIPGKIEIPVNLGTIESRYHASNPEAPFIVILQDAHAIIDAQRQTQKLLGYFQKQYGIDLVALEGGKGPVDATLFRTFPDAMAKKKVMGDYLEKAEITGAQMAAVFNEQEGRYFGIEDWNLYEDNYLAYARAAQKKAAALQKLQGIQNSLDEKRKLHFSSELNQLHDRAEAFREEKINLVDFLKGLSISSSPNASAAKQPFRAGDPKMDSRFRGNDMENAYPHLAALMTSLGKEDSFKKEDLAVSLRKMAEAFRKKALGRMDKKQVMEFNERFRAFQSGETDNGSFLKFLVETGTSLGFKPRLTQSMRELLGNVQTLSAIKGSRLFKELENFISERELSFARSPEEKELLGQYQKLALLRSLASLELTHDQLREYQKDPQSYFDLLSETCANCHPEPTPRHPERSEGSPTEILRHPSGIPQNDIISPALEFYRLALERDKSFRRNLKDLLKRQKSKTAIVIAGGFHTQGFEENLKADGYSYAVVMPKINSVDGKDRYTDLMQGKLSYKNYLKTTFYDAFARAATVKLVGELSAPDFKRNLKVWRDEVIRKLAREGRTVDANKYTAYIDLLFKVYYEKFGDEKDGLSKEEILKAVETELQKFRKQKVAELWKNFESQLGSFTQGLKTLIDRKELNLKNIATLLDQSAQPKGLGTLQLSLATMTPNPDVRPRSEMRKLIETGTVEARTRVLQETIPEAQPAMIKNELPGLDEERLQGEFSQWWNFAVVSIEEEHLKLGARLEAKRVAEKPVFQSETSPGIFYKIANPSKMMDRARGDSLKAIEEANGLILQEARILIKLEKERIQGVPKLEAIGKTNDGRLWMQIKGSTGKSFAKYNFETSEVFTALAETGKILNRLSLSNVFHNDINPNNLFIDYNKQGKMEVQIIDFDNATQWDVPPWGHTAGYAPIETKPDGKEKLLAKTEPLVVYQLIMTLNRLLVGEGVRKFKNKYLKKIFENDNQSTLKNTKTWPTLEQLTKEFTRDALNVVAPPAQLVLRSELRENKPGQSEIKEFKSFEEFFENYRGPLYESKNRIGAESGQSVRQIIDASIPGSMKALDAIVKMRQWMDETAARGRPLVIFQNMRLGEFYPLLTSKILEKLDIKVISSEKILNKSNEDMREYSSARIIVVRDKVPSSIVPIPIEAKQFLIALGALVNDLKAPLVIADHSANPVSNAQYRALELGIGNNASPVWMDLQKNALYGNIPGNEKSFKAGIGEHSSLILLNPSTLTPKTPGQVSPLDDSYFLSKKYSEDQEPLQVRVAGKIYDLRELLLKLYTEKIDLAARQAFPDLFGLKRSEARSDQTVEDPFFEETVKARFPPDLKFMMNWPKTGHLRPLPRIKEMPSLANLNMALSKIGKWQDEQGRPNLEVVYYPFQEGKCTYGHDIRFGFRIYGDTEFVELGIDEIVNLDFLKIFNGQARVKKFKEENLRANSQYPFVLGYLALIGNAKIYAELIKKADAEKNSDKKALLEAFHAIAHFPENPLQLFPVFESRIRTAAGKELSLDFDSLKNLLSDYQDRLPEAEKSWRADIPYNKVLGTVLQQLRLKIARAVQEAMRGDFSFWNELAPLYSEYFDHMAPHSIHAAATIKALMLFEKLGTLNIGARNSFERVASVGDGPGMQIRIFKRLEKFLKALGASFASLKYYGFDGSKKMSAIAKEIALSEGLDKNYSQSHEDITEKILQDKDGNKIPDGFFDFVQSGLMGTLGDGDNSQNVMRKIFVLNEIARTTRKGGAVILTGKNNAFSKDLIRVLKEKFHLEALNPGEADQALHYTDEEINILTQDSAQKAKLKSHLAGAVALVLVKTDEAGFYETPEKLRELSQDKVVRRDLAYEDFARAEDIEREIAARAPPREVAMDGLHYEDLRPEQIRVETPGLVREAKAKAGETKRDEILKKYPAFTKQLYDFQRIRKLLTSKEKGIVERVEDFLKFLEKIEETPGVFEQAVSDLQKLHWEMTSQKGKKVFTLERIQSEKNGIAENFERGWNAIRTASPFSLFFLDDFSQKDIHKTFWDFREGDAKKPKMSYRVGELFAILDFGEINSLTAVKWLIQNLIHSQEETGLSLTGDQFLPLLQSPWLLYFLENLHQRGHTPAFRMDQLSASEADHERHTPVMSFSSQSFHHRHSWTQYQPGIQKLTTSVIHTLSLMARESAGTSQLESRKMLNLFLELAEPLFLEGFLQNGLITLDEYAFLRDIDKKKDYKNYFAMNSLSVMSVRRLVSFVRQGKLTPEAFILETLKNKQRGLQKKISPLTKLSNEQEKDFKSLLAWDETGKVIEAIKQFIQEHPDMPSAEFPMIRSEARMVPDKDRLVEMIRQPGLTDFTKMLSGLLTPGIGRMFGDLLDARSFPALSNSNLFWLSAGFLILLTQSWLALLGTGAAVLMSIFVPNFRDLVIQIAQRDLPALKALRSEARTQINKFPEETMKAEAERILSNDQGKETLKRLNQLFQKKFDGLILKEGYSLDWDKSSSRFSILKERFDQKGKEMGFISLHFILQAGIVMAKVGYRVNFEKGSGLPSLFLERLAKTTPENIHLLQTVQNFQTLGMFLQDLKSRNELTSEERMSAGTFLTRLESYIETPDSPAAERFRDEITEFLLKIYRNNHSVKPLPGSPALRNSVLGKLARHFGEGPARLEINERDQSLELISSKPRSEARTDSQSKLPRNFRLSSPDVNGITWIFDEMSKNVMQHVPANSQFEIVVMFHEDLKDSNKGLLKLTFQDHGQGLPLGTLIWPVEAYDHMLDPNLRADDQKYGRFYAAGQKLREVLLEDAQKKGIDGEAYIQENRLLLQRFLNDQTMENLGELLLKRDPAINITDKFEEMLPTFVEGLAAIGGRGLATTYQRVTRLKDGKKREGADMRIFSEKGNGTRVTIDYPLTRVPSTQSKTTLVALVKEMIGQIEKEAGRNNIEVITTLVTIPRAEARSNKKTGKEDFPDRFMKGSIFDAENIKAEQKISKRRETVAVDLDDTLLARDFKDKKKIILLPGERLAQLKKLKDNGIRLVLWTTAGKKRAEDFFEAYPEAKELFEKVITYANLEIDLEKVKRIYKEEKDREFYKSIPYSVGQKDIALFGYKLIIDDRDPYSEEKETAHSQFPWIKIKHSPLGKFLHYQIPQLHLGETDPEPVTEMANTILKVLKETKKMPKSELRTSADRRSEARSSPSIEPPDRLASTKRILPKDEIDRDDALDRVARAAIPQYLLDHGIIDWKKEEIEVEAIGAGAQFRVYDVPRKGTPEIFHDVFKLGRADSFGASSDGAPLKSQLEEFFSRLGRAAAKPEEITRFVNFGNEAEVDPGIDLNPDVKIAIEADRDGEGRLRRYTLLRQEKGIPLLSLYHQALQIKDPEERRQKMAGVLGDLLRLHNYLLTERGVFVVDANLGNAILTVDGQVKLSDFGRAIAVNKEGDYEFGLEPSFNLFDRHANLLGFFSLIGPIIIAYNDPEQRETADILLREIERLATPEAGREPLPLAVFLRKILRPENRDELLRVLNDFFDPAKPASSEASWDQLGDKIQDEIKTGIKELILKNESLKPVRAAGLSEEIATGPDENQAADFVSQSKALQEGFNLLAKKIVEHDQVNKPEITVMKTALAEAEKNLESKEWHKALDHWIEFKKKAEIIYDREDSKSPLVEIEMAENIKKPLIRWLDGYLVEIERLSHRIRDNLNPRSEARTGFVTKVEAETALRQFADEVKKAKADFFDAFNQKKDSLDAGFNYSRSVSIAIDGFLKNMELQNLSVFLMGSFAFGYATPFSDIELLSIANDESEVEEVRAKFRTIGGMKDAFKMAGLVLDNFHSKDAVSWASYRKDIKASIDQNADFFTSLPFIRPLSQQMGDLKKMNEFIEGLIEPGLISASLASLKLKDHEFSGEKLNFKKPLKNNNAVNGDTRQMFLDAKRTRLGIRTIQTIIAALYVQNFLGSAKTSKKDFIAFSSYDNASPVSVRDLLSVVAQSAPQFISEDDLEALIQALKSYLFIKARTEKVWKEEKDMPAEEQLEEWIRQEGGALLKNMEGVRAVTQKVINSIRSEARMKDQEVWTHYWERFIFSPVDETDEIKDLWETEFQKLKTRNAQGKILDLGSGPYLDLLRRAEAVSPDFRLTGVDIAQIQPEELGKIEYKVMDVTQGLGDFKDGSFDLVISRRLLEYIPLQKAVKVLKEIGRVLNKEGEAVILMRHPGSQQQQWLARAKAQIQFIQEMGLWDIADQYVQAFREKGAENGDLRRKLEDARQKIKRFVGEKQGVKILETPDAEYDIVNTHKEEFAEQQIRGIWEFVIKNKQFAMLGSYRAFFEDFVREVQEKPLYEWYGSTSQIKSVLKKAGFSNFSIETLKKENSILAWQIRIFKTVRSEARAKAMDSTPVKLQLKSYDDVLAANASLRKFLKSKINFPDSFAKAKDPQDAYRAKVWKVLEKAVQWFLEEENQLDESATNQKEILHRAGREIKQAWYRHGYDQLSGAFSPYLNMLNSRFMRPTEYLRTQEILQGMFGGDDRERLHALWMTGVAYAMHLGGIGMHLEYVNDTPENRGRMDRLGIRYDTLDEFPGQLTALLDNEFLIQDIREFSRLLYLNRRELQRTKIQLTREYSNGGNLPDRRIETIEVTEWEVMMWGFAMMLNPYPHLPFTFHADFNSLDTRYFTPYAKKRWGVDYEKNRTHSYFEGDEAMALKRFDVLNLSAAREFAERLAQEDPDWKMLPEDSAKKRLVILAEMANESIRVSEELSLRDRRFVSPTEDHLRISGQRRVHLGYYSPNGYFSKLMIAHDFPVDLNLDKIFMRSLPRPNVYTPEGIANDFLQRSGSKISVEPGVPAGTKSVPMLLKVAVPKLTEFFNRAVIAENWSGIEEAAQILKRAGPEARAAVPSLIENFRKVGHHSSFVADALIAIGVDPKWVKPLLDIFNICIKEGDWSGIRSAALVLGSIGANAKEAVPSLIEALPKARPSADAVAAALIQIGVGAESVPALIAAFNRTVEEEDWRPIESTAQIFEAMGLKAEEALPALRASLRKKSAHVYQSAVENAIQSISGKPVRSEARTSEKFEEEIGKQGGLDFSLKRVVSEREMQEMIDKMNSAAGRDLNLELEQVLQIFKDRGIMERDRIDAIYGEIIRTTLQLLREIKSKEDLVGTIFSQRLEENIRKVLQNKVRENLILTNAITETIRIAAAKAFVLGVQEAGSAEKLDLSGLSPEARILLSNPEVLAQAFKEKTRADLPRRESILLYAGFLEVFDVFFEEGVRAGRNFGLAYDREVPEQARLVNQIVRKIPQAQAFPYDLWRLLTAMRLGRFRKNGKLIALLSEEGASRLKEELKGEVLRSEPATVKLAVDEIGWKTFMGLAEIVLSQYDVLNQKTLNAVMPLIDALTQTEAARQAASRAA